MPISLTRRESRQYEHLKNFEHKTVEELRERAHELNIDEFHRMNKKELLLAIWRLYN